MIIPGLRMLIKKWIASFTSSASFYQKLGSNIGISQYANNVDIMNVKMLIISLVCNIMHNQLFQILAGGGLL